MARKKKTEELNNEESVVVENNTPNFTAVAFGINKGEGQLFELVEIQYDPKTGQTGNSKVVVRDVFEDIVDKFKINAAEKFLTRSNG